MVNLRSLTRENYLAHNSVPDWCNLLSNTNERSVRFIWKKLRLDLKKVFAPWHSRPSVAFSSEDNWCRQPKDFNDLDYIRMEVNTWEHI